MSVQLFDIWVEGYRDNGMSASAQLVNREPIAAESFDDAVRQYVASAPKSEQPYWRRDDDGTWSMWACRAFPTHEEAARSFG